MLQNMLQKERKIDLLCRGYVYIYIWGCKGCPLGENLKSEVPTVLLEKITPHLEKPLSALIPILKNYARYLPKEVIARKIVEFLYGQLDLISLEKSMLCLLNHLLDREGVVYTLRTNEELDTVIAKLCSDEKLPCALLSKFMTGKAREEEPKPTNTSILESLLQTVRSSMSEKVSKSVLQSIPWQETFFHLLEEIRFFSLSIHCDKALVESLNQAMDH
jgi:hypothetical protein